MLSVLNTD